MMPKAIAASDDASLLGMWSWRPVANHQRNPSLSSTTSTRTMVTPRCHGLVPAWPAPRTSSTLLLRLTPTAVRVATEGAVTPFPRSWGLPPNTVGKIESVGGCASAPTGSPFGAFPDARDHTVRRLEAGGHGGT